MKKLFTFLLVALPFHAFAYQMKINSAEFLVVPEMKITKFNNETVTVSWNGKKHTLKRKSLFNQGALSSGSNVYLRAKDFNVLAKSVDPKFSLQSALTACEPRKNSETSVPGREGRVALVGDLNCKGLMVPFATGHQTVMCDKRSQTCEAFVSMKLVKAGK